MCERNAVEFCTRVPFVTASCPWSSICSIIWRRNTVACPRFERTPRNNRFFHRSFCDYCVKTLLHESSTTMLDRRIIAKSKREIKKKKNSKRGEFETIIGRDSFRGKNTVYRSDESFLWRAPINKVSTKQRSNPIYPYFFLNSLLICDQRVYINHRYTLYFSCVNLSSSSSTIKFGQGKKMEKDCLVPIRRKA